MKPFLLNCLIIDDEPDSIDQLVNLLDELGTYYIQKTLTSPVPAISKIVTLQPDIVFLDIQMPEKTGIELLSEIAKLENQPQVVMVTAYNNYILDALRNNAFDYLLKPIDREELHKCTQRLLKNHNPGKPIQNFKGLLKAINEKIVLSSVYETYYINAHEIAYIEADGRYSDVYLTNGSRIKTTCNLGKLIEKINHNTLQRISRSHLINSKFLFKQNNRTKTCVLQYNSQEIELAYSKKYFG